MARGGFNHIVWGIGPGIGTMASLMSVCHAQNAKQAHSTTPPAIHAAAAIIVDGRTGATLWAKSPDLRLPPASTTKIATALLLCRDLAPSQPVVTSPTAARTPGHALGMKPGEKFRAQDLLYALMLASANDAGVAIAEQEAGSESAFAARMNAWAQASGAVGTHFRNASGLPAPDHYATARDLAAMARAALQNPAFASTARTRTYQIPGAGNRPSHTLTNENRLLWTVPGMDGVKAGWTQEAGGCFVGSATRNGKQILTVVLNSPDWQRETTALVNYGFTLPDIAAKTTTTADARADSRADRRAVVVPVKATSPKTNFGHEGANPPAGKVSPANITASNAASNVPLPASHTTSGFGGAAPIDPAGRRVGVEGTDLSSKRTESPTDQRKDPESKTGSRSGSNAGSRSGSPTENKTGSETGSHPRAGTSNWNWPGLALPDQNHPSDQKSALPENDRPTPSKTGRVSPSALSPSSRFTADSASRSGSILVRYSFLLPLLALVLGLCFLLLVAALLRRRKGRFTMPDFLFGLFGKRHNPRPAPALVAAAYGTSPSALPVLPTCPAFTFVAPVLQRREGPAWLESVLEAPARLLEPATRRQALAIREADPRACEAKVLSLLTSSTFRTRLLGAELIGAYTPHLAEEMLLGMLKDEQVSGDIRAEAIQLLAKLGGGRHERLWLQMLLREGTLAAAHALTRLPRLEDSTAQALRHVLTNGSETRESEGELKRQMRSAQIAGVLMAQGHFTRLQAAPYLNALPANHGEPIVVAALRGSRQPEAVEALVEIVLHGHAYPALQSLMESDPRVVRATLDPLWPKLDKAERTRATILKWLVLGEGNAATLQELAGAGNDLARGALQLGRLHRWEPSHSAPDALLAAAQIYSLRLGFSLHAQEDIILAFRKAATDRETQSLAALPPELQPLAQAYAHPEVYDAVQVAMHTEDGLIALLATLSRHSDKAPYRQELAFWCDKMPRESRLMLTHALCAGEPTASEEKTRDVLAERAVDPDALVRSVALRWLHAHPQETDQSKAEQSKTEQSAVERRTAEQTDAKEMEAERTQQAVSEQEGSKQALYADYANYADSANAKEPNEDNAYHDDSSAATLAVRKDGDG